MMPSKAYQKCLLIINKVIEAGNFKATRWSAVEFMIAKHIGADPRTIRKYKNWLLEFGLLKKLRDGSGRVGLNLPLLQKELGDKKQLELEVQEK